MCLSQPLSRNGTENIACGTAYLCKRFPGWIWLALFLLVIPVGIWGCGCFSPSSPVGRNCWISSELECSSHGTILGLASGRSRILFSLCFPFMLLVFEVVSQLVRITRGEQFHADSLGYSLFLFSEIPLEEAEIFSNIFLMSVFQIQCCCGQFKDISERTGICRRTLTCGAASNAQHLSFHPVYSLLYSCKAREVQLGKGYRLSHKATVETSDVPQWHLSLAILKLPGKWEVSEDFPFPSSLWYTSFTLASIHKAVMLRLWGRIGC